MVLVSVQQVQQEGWLELIKGWGHGRAHPRYLYSRDCTEQRFPNHLVLNGPHPSGSGSTDSGFLVDSARKVVGGVDAIFRAD